MTGRGRPLGRVQHPVARSTAPYQFFGQLDYIDSTGSRPVELTWQLRTPMPEDTFEVARAVVAAA